MTSRSRSPVTDSTDAPAWPAARARRAFVELNCAPGRLDEVAAALEREPMVLSIEYVARGCDLLLTVVASSFAAMFALVIDRLNQVPGVTTAHTHVVGAVHQEGADWSLDALSPVQVEAVRASGRVERRSAGSGLDPYSPVYGELTRELGRDGRMSAAELAERLHRPASSVRRQLTVLMASESLAFRCEVAQLLTRWPICATMWIAAADIDGAVAWARKRSNVRLCAALVGRPNLLITVWSHSVTELMATQKRLERAVDVIQVENVSITMRIRKRMGWLMDADGRVTGEVIPVEPPRSDLAESSSRSTPCHRSSV